MKVLFVASECVPYAKTGGLGDVISALPIEFQKKLNIESRVIIPYYKQVANWFMKNPVHKITFLARDLEALFNTENRLKKIYSFNILQSTIPKSDVIIYFIDIKEFFNRPNLYVDERGRAFSDSAEIYAYFCKAVFEVISLLNINEQWYPDIIHANDWHTGLLPLFIKYKIHTLPRPIKTVFTIHNMAYQGKFSLDKLGFLGFSNNETIKSELVHKNKNPSIIYLKAGIVCSDFVTTVSETYRNELLTDEFGYGLQDYLINRGDNFVGIMNGVDYSEWNPFTDELIKKKYSENDLKGKMECKNELVVRFGIPDIEIPIIGMVSRLDHQKGVELILDAIPRLKDLKIHIIIVGTGKKKYEEKLLYLQEELGYLSVIIGFNNKLAHEVEAGSDFFLMPSKYEPCGLNQLYSLKYGTIPIVRKTGGLADSIIDVVEGWTGDTDDFGDSNGFTFNEYDAKELEHSIRRAVSFYFDVKNKPRYNRLLKNIMGLDFSWRKSSIKFKKLYQNLLNS